MDESVHSVNIQPITQSNFLNVDTYLKIIRKGVKAWNSWRKNNPSESPILDGITLLDLDLSGIDFSGLSLKRTIINRCNLSSANLISANFTQANLQANNFSNTRMIAVKLNQADLSDSEIEGANMLTASIEGACLHGLDFRNHDLRSLRLRGVSFSKANLSGQNLSNTDLSYTDLSQCILNDVNFKGANFSHANLTKTKFFNCDIRGCHFRQANLENANLRRCELTNVNFEDANLCNTDFRESDIIDTDFSRADITGTLLWKAQCRSWILKHLKCDFAYWDEQGKEKTYYNKHDFERMYSKSIQIELRYPYRLSTTEISTLPIFIEHLEASFWGTTLRLKSIQDVAGGAAVNLSVDEVGRYQPAELKDQMQEEANRVQLAQLAFRKDISLQRELKEELANIKESFWPRLLELALENEREHIRNLTIVFIDLKGFSEWGDDELSNKLSLFRGLIKPILERWHASHPNMEGDSLRVTFRNASAGLACACMMQSVLTAAGFEVRAGVEIGEVTVLHNEVTDISDIEGSAVIMAARLEGAAEPGQVLASEKVRHYIKNANDFEFLSVNAELKKSVGNKKPGDIIQCYSIVMKANDINSLQ